MVRRMGLGTGELLVVLLVLLIVFSASRMGAIGNALGRFVYSFKKAAQGQGFVDAAKPLKRQDVEDAEVVSPPAPRKPKR
jgi:sec-independent protein translocase protein TatA